MTPETRLEARVASLIGAYADRASTAIDPLAMTRLAAASSSRQGSRPWRGGAGRDLRPVLLVMGLLLALLAGVSAVGAQRFIRDSRDVLPRSGTIQPFLGLPPEGVSPSAPERGKLVLSFVGRVYSLGMDVHAMSLYEDGRLIWGRNLESRYDLSAYAGLAPTVQGPTVIEQRLTAAGVEQVRDEVLANRLEGPCVAPACVNAAPGILWGGIQVLDGDRMDSLRWTDARLPGRLADLASWLPSSAWANPGIGAYVAPRYGVCGPDVGLFPTHVRDAVLERSTGMASSEDPPGTACHVVGIDAAREIAEILADAAIRTHVKYNGTDYEVGRNGSVRIWLLPLTPDDRPIWVGWAG